MANDSEYDLVDALLAEVTAERDALKAEVKRLRRTVDRNRKHWIRASKKALDGDTRELWTRVQMCEAEPLEIVPSAALTQEDG